MQNPPDEKSIIQTKTGHSLYYDSLTGRYFYSEMPHIERAINAVNAKIIKQGYASVNDFFYELGLPPVKLGEQLGWNRNYEEELDIFFDHELTSYGDPCGILDYYTYPTFDFDKMH